METINWLVAASARAPLSMDELRAHVAASMVDAVNPTLAALGPLELVDLRSPTQAVVRVGGVEHLLRVHVDSNGLVDNVDLNRHEPALASWSELDARLTALGARVSFAATEVDVSGRCRIVHGHDADVPRPIGSGFKLYVLGALARAVADGTAAWDEPLPIRDEWRSPFSRDLENRPTGAVLTLADHANAMMAVSDNTATDHLIHRLGRDAVQRQFARFGHHQPDANTPPLTTKAFFHLKTGGAKEYLALPEDERLGYLEDLEMLPPLDPRATWAEPRDIDDVEFFASAADICRAYAGLLALDQPEIGHALATTDEGLNLDQSRFPVVWFKPGREAGVQSQNYLAFTVDGRTYAVCLLVSDPTAAFDITDMTARGQAVIRHAFALL